MYEDLIPSKPALQLADRQSGLSTDPKPTMASDGTALQVGAEWRATDTGLCFYWDGSLWQPVIFSQKLDQLVELQFEILRRLNSQTEE